MPDAPLLEINAIDAFYGDFQALFAVSLSVKAGQVAAVIGANGAGKSTLLKTIAGLMHPHSGEILFAGSPTTHVRAFDALETGHRFGAGRTQTFSIADSRGEPVNRGSDAPARLLDIRPYLRVVPGTGRTPASPRAGPVGRTAANGGNRARTHVEPAFVVVR